METQEVREENTAKWRVKKKSKRGKKKKEDVE